MSLITWPYRILVLAFLLLAGIGFGYVEGISRESDRRDAQELTRALDTNKAQAAAQTKADKESARRENVGAQRETTREQIRIVYRTIKEQADEIVKNTPAINTCGLDADGLRVWNDANTGTSTTAPVFGQPDRAVSDAISSQVGQPGRLIAEPHRVNGTGSTVPGSVGEAGSLHQPSTR